MAKTSDLVLQASGVAKSFHDAGQRLSVLAKVDLNVTQGERVAITGFSGSGKTTLLYLLGGLDRPDEGDILINGRRINDMNERSLAAWRNLHLAYVFQQHHLLRSFSALENVALPLLIRGVARKEAMEKANHYLAGVNMSDRANHLPEQLSGGQSQRVAIAQALAGEPRCVLMDEPTGNLDEENAALIQDLLLTLSDEHKVSIVMATHNKVLAGAMQSEFALRGGTLERR